VAPALTAEREDGSPKSAERQQSLPNRDPSPEPSQDGAGSNPHSDDELDNPDSDEDNKKRRLTKRKRPSLSCDGPIHKKRKDHLQRRSTRQYRPHSKLHRPFQSHSPPDQGLRVAEGSSGEDRLPSPAPSAPRTTDTETPPNNNNLGGSPSSFFPTLSEITFRPYSQYCYSFTAVIRQGYDGQGVSFSQVAQLIESIGHIGKIDDFTIKLLQQHSFLLTGFSQHTSSRLSSGGTTLLTAAEASATHRDVTHTRLQLGRAADTRTLMSQGSSDDSDAESTSGCLSEAEQGHSSTSKQRRWPDLDEQRLLVYKKEGKSWDWIFGKFPCRTRPAIRTRWNIVRLRGE